MQNPFFFFFGRRSGAKVMYRERVVKEEYNFVMPFLAEALEN